MAKRNQKKLPEYVLHIFHATDDLSQERVVVFLVRTVKEFVSFGYEILLEDSRRDREINMKILGLHTPAMIMPGTGPAYGVRAYQNLSGFYQLSVAKLNRSTNEFTIKITPDAIALVQSPSNPFIQLTTEVFEFH